MAMRVYDDNCNRLALTENVRNSELLHFGSVTINHICSQYLFAVMHLPNIIHSVEIEFTNTLITYYLLINNFFS